MGSLYVVLVAWDGDCENSEVYATADNRVCREVPGAYAEVVPWDEAERLGLVS